MSRCANPSDLVASPCGGAHEVDIQQLLFARAASHIGRPVCWLPRSLQWRGAGGRRYVSALSACHPVGGLRFTIVDSLSVEDIDSVEIDF